VGEETEMGFVSGTLNDGSENEPPPNPPAAAAPLSAAAAVVAEVVPTALGFSLPAAEVSDVPKEKDDGVEPPLPNAAAGPPKERADDGVASCDDGVVAGP
jgi:hypothetical protein